MQITRKGSELFYTLGKKRPGISTATFTGVDTQGISARFLGGLLVVIIKKKASGSAYSLSKREYTEARSVIVYANLHIHVQTCKFSTNFFSCTLKT